MIMTTLETTEIGHPCMMGEVVGRIVGHCDDGSKGDVNGIEMHSIVEFSSPHGTIFKTGVFHLSEMTDKGMEQLKDYEQQAKESDCKYYADKLQPHHKKLK